MRFGEHKRIIFVSCLVGIVLNSLIEFILNDVTDTEALVGSLIRSLTNSTKTVLILTGWWWFYFRIGWRLPVVNLLLRRINLNGTWFGKYRSHDHKGETFSGEIALRIRQYYLSISLISLTNKYQHYSYSEELKYDEKSGRHGIVYTYSQNEDSTLGTIQRNGTSELSLKNIEGKCWLEGDFWTVHGTRGTICVRWICENHIDSFREAKSIADARSMS